MNWSNIYCIIYYVARLQISQEETYKFERNWANNWSLSFELHNGKQQHYELHWNVKLTI